MGPKRVQSVALINAGVASGLKISIEKDPAAKSSPITNDYSFTIIEWPGQPLIFSEMRNYPKDWRQLFENAVLPDERTMEAIMDHGLAARIFDNMIVRFDEFPKDTEKFKFADYVKGDIKWIVALQIIQKRHSNKLPVDMFKMRYASDYARFIVSATELVRLKAHGVMYSPHDLSLVDYPESNPQRHVARKDIYSATDERSPNLVLPEDVADNAPAFEFEKYLLDILACVPIENLLELVQSIQTRYVQIPVFLPNKSFGYYKTTYIQVYMCVLELMYRANVTKACAKFLTHVYRTKSQKSGPEYNLWLVPLIIAYGTIDMPHNPREFFRLADTIERIVEDKTRGILGTADKALIDILATSVKNIIPTAIPSNSKFGPLKNEMETLLLSDSLLERCRCLVPITDDYNLFANKDKADQIKLGEQLYTYSNNKYTNFWTWTALMLEHGVLDHLIGKVREGLPISEKYDLTYDIIGTLIGPITEEFEMRDDDEDEVFTYKLSYMLRSMVDEDGKIVSQISYASCDNNDEDIDEGPVARGREIIDDKLWDGIGYKTEFELPGIPIRKGTLITDRTMKSLMEDAIIKTVATCDSAALYDKIDSIVGPIRSFIAALRNTTISIPVPYYILSMLSAKIASKMRSDAEAFARLYGQPRVELSTQIVIAIIAMFSNISPKRHFYYPLTSAQIAGFNYMVARSIVNPNMFNLLGENIYYNDLLESYKFMDQFLEENPLPNNVLTKESVIRTSVEDLDLKSHQKLIVEELQNATIPYNIIRMGTGTGKTRSVLAFLIETYQRYKTVFWIAPESAYPGVAGEFKRIFDFEMVMYDIKYGTCEGEVYFVSSEKFTQFEKHCDDARRIFARDCDQCLFVIDELHRYTAESAAFSFVEVGSMAARRTIGMSATFFKGDSLEGYLRYHVTRASNRPVTGQFARGAMLASTITAGFRKISTEHYAKFEVDQLFGLITAELKQQNCIFIVVDSAKSAELLKEKISEATKLDPNEILIRIKDNKIEMDARLTEDEGVGPGKFIGSLPKIVLTPKTSVTGYNMNHFTVMLFFCSACAQITRQQAMGRIQRVDNIASDVFYHFCISDEVKRYLEEIE